MSASFNRVILVGHLGKDPNVSVTKSGQSVARMSLATSERTKDQDGQWTERTEWHTVIAWGKDAEFCGNYLAKGALVMVEGKLQTRKWQDKDGQDRYSTEVVAHRVQGLSKSKEQAAGGHIAPSSIPQGDDLGPAFPSAASGMDDVPF